MAWNACGVLSGTFDGTASFNVVDIASTQRKVASMLRRYCLYVCMSVRRALKCRQRNYGIMGLNRLRGVSGYLGLFSSIS